VGLLRKKAYPVVFLLRRRTWPFQRNHAYDVIILDIMSRDLHGLEICRILREQKISIRLAVDSPRLCRDDSKGAGTGRRRLLTSRLPLLSWMARIRALSLSFSHRRLVNLQIAI